ncbi:MAG: transketolase C-terminal domain-containing protein, partial [Gammaproteobacteria bacterium]
TDFHVGRAEVVAEGRDVTILCYGALLGECHGACARLREHGLSVGLINLRCLKPVDSAAMLRAARGSALLVTVEDHFQTGGLYSLLAELLLGEGLRARCLPIALHERWFKPALLPEVLEYEGYTAAAITDKVLRHWGTTG